MNRMFMAISFAVFYVKEVLLSNFRVAYDVLTPRHRMKPGIVTVDVGGMTDRQIFMMANLITMTPGTLGLTVSKDRQSLFIHAMYIDGSPEEMAAKLRKDFKGRVVRVF